MLAFSSPSRSPRGREGSSISKEANEVVKAGTTGSGGNGGSINERRQRYIFPKRPRIKPRVSIKKERGQPYVRPKSPIKKASDVAKKAVKDVDKITDALLAAFEKKKMDQGADQSNKGAMSFEEKALQWVKEGNNGIFAGVAVLAIVFIMKRWF